MGSQGDSVPRKERQARAADQLAVMGLGGFMRHYPHELSGGMRQRTAIARDIEEALLLADRVLVMSGQPGEICAEIRSPFGRPPPVCFMHIPKTAGQSISHMLRLAYWRRDVIAPKVPMAAQRLRMVTSATAARLCACPYLQQPRGVHDERCCLRRDRTCL
jgi:hypothetical protein